MLGFMLQPNLLDWTRRKRRAPYLHVGRLSSSGETYERQVSRSRHILRPSHVARQRRLLGVPEGSD